MKMAFSYSTLSIPCDRALWMKLHEQKPEIWTAEETEQGKALHREVEKMFRLNQFGYSDVLENDIRFPEGYEEAETEVKLFTKINGLDLLWGVIDVILARKDGQATIIEIKSSYSSELNMRIRKQLRYYAFLYLCGTDKSKVEIAAYFPYWSEIRRPNKYIYTRDDIKRLKMGIEEDIRRAKEIALQKSQLVYTSPSPYCLYCSYSLSCPVVDRTSPEELALEYLKLKAKLKNLETKLRAITAKEGLIKVENQSLGFHPSFRHVVDEQNLVQYLREKAIGVELALSPDIKKIKKLAKEIEDIAQFISVVETPRWGVKALTKEESNEVD